MAQKFFSPLSLLLALVIILSSGSAAHAFAVKDEPLPGIIEEYIREREDATAGLALAAFREGEIIYQKYYGHRDVEQGLPVDEETIFEWGSVTKVLTWVSVMQLVEEGKLSLDEDIRTYLPEGFLRKLRFDEPITLLHLMHHQAGFQEVIYSDEFRDLSDVPPLGEALRRSEPAQVSAPGAVTAYSNYGAALAGYIVECVSGQSFSDYVHEHIFEVLGMEHTALQPGWADNPRVRGRREETKSYSFLEDGKESYGAAVVHIALYPAGSCAGTLGDFARFAAEFTSGDTRLFQKQETMEAFLSPSLYYEGGKTSRNHHGLWTLDYGAHLLGHGGNTQGFTCGLWFDPQTATGLVIMSNEVGETTYNYGLLERLYGRVELQPVPQEDISGIYYSKRSFEEGFARIATYASALMPIQKTSEEGRFQLAFLDFPIVSLGGGVYRMDSQNGLATNLYRAQESVLQSYTSDYGKLSAPEALLAAFLVIAALIVLLFVIVRGAILLVRRIQKKRLSLYAKGNALALVPAALICLIFFYLWLFIGAYIYEQVMLVCLVLAAAMLAVTANLLFQIGARGKRQNTPGDLAQALILFLPVLTALFFETYKFWV